MSELCVLCGKLFGHKQALEKHLKWVHTRRRGKYKCNKCDKQFRNIKSMENHQQAHEKGTVRSSDVYVCPLCRNNFDKTNIYAHFVYTHNIEISIQSMAFQSVELFDRWKQDLELKTIARYTKRRAPTINKDGSITSYFYCHRDGYFRPRGLGLRSLKRTGSNRIDGHCPSMMEVNQSNGLVYVKFTETHVGHSNDLERLKPVQKNKLANQLPTETSTEGAHQLPVSATEISEKDTSQLPVAVTETSVKGVYQLSVAATEISAEDVYNLSDTATNTSAKDPHQFLVAAKEAAEKNIQQVSEEEAFTLARKEEVQCEDGSDNLIIDYVAQNCTVIQQSIVQNSVQGTHQISVSESKSEELTEKLANVTETQCVDNSNDFVIPTQNKSVGNQLATNISEEDVHQCLKSGAEEEFSKRKVDILEINFNIFKELIQNEDQLWAFIMYANATKHLIRRLETKENTQLRRKKAVLRDPSNKNSLVRKKIFSICKANINKVKQILKPPQVKMNPIRILQSEALLHSKVNICEKKFKCKHEGISHSDTLHHVYDHSYASEFCRQTDHT